MPDAGDLRRRLLGRANRAACASGASLLVLDLLGRLPEEEVGADRRAEHRDDGDDVLRVSTRAAARQARARPRPSGHDDEHRRDIGEQRQRQPFQHRDVARIADEDLEQARKPARRARHRAHCGPPISSFSAAAIAPRSAPRLIVLAIDEQTDDAVEQPGRVVLAQVAGDAAAGHPADPRADLLDRRTSADS